jgi:hypothetical protein
LRKLATAFALSDAAKFALLSRITLIALAVLASLTPVGTLCRR